MCFTQLKARHYLSQISIHNPNNKIRVGCSYGPDAAQGASHILTHLKVVLLGLCLIDENPEHGPPEPESSLHQSDPRGLLFMSHTTWDKWPGSFLPETWIKPVLYAFDAESSSSAQMFLVSAMWQFLMFWVILSPLKNHFILIYAGRSGVIIEHAGFCINRPSCASSPPWLVASFFKKNLCKSWLKGSAIKNHAP